MLIINVEEIEKMHYQQLLIKEWKWVDFYRDYKTQSNFNKIKIL